MGRIDWSKRIKKCASCGVEGPHYKQASSKDGFDRLCVKCRKEYRDSPEGKAKASKWRSDHKYSSKAWVLSHKYKLTREVYDEMLSKQNNACAICGRELCTLEVYNKELKPSKPCVDHDHSSGMVRGLLCSRCNVAVGMFEDDPERMLSAAVYLLRAEKQCDDAMRDDRLRAYVEYLRSLPSRPRGRPPNEHRSIFDLEEELKRRRTEMRVDNTTGARGVVRHLSRWKAQIQVNKKNYYLGVFDTFEEAKNAYEEADSRRSRGEPIVLKRVA